MRRAVAAALVALTCLSGCGGGSGPGSDTSATDTPTDDSSSGPDAVYSAPPSPTPDAVPTFALGQPASFEMDGSLAVLVTPEVGVQVSQRAAANDDKPKNGYYVTFPVTVYAAQQIDVNPFDFYVALPDGTRFDVGTGNAVTAAGDNALHSTTLNPKEKIKGTLTFDIPAPHGHLVFAPASRALGYWTF